MEVIMMKKISCSLACCLLLTSLFAGGNKDTASEAKELVIYASVDEGNTQKILEAFTTDTGIKVQSVHLSSGPALARIQAEAGRPQADVWLGAPSDNHIAAKEQGLTIAYKSDTYNHLNAGFKDPDGYWRCFYMNPLCFGVNKTALAKAGAPMPTSWADILKPEYKGIIQAPTPQSAGTAKVMVYSLIELMGEDEAYKYMAALNKNIQTYTSSGTGPSKGVGVGDCAIGIQFTPAFFNFIHQGYPVEVVFPKEGVGYEAPAVSILKGVKNLEAAKIFVDWLVSKKGQDALSEKQTFFYPVIPEASLGAGMPPFSSLKVVSYNTRYYAENTNRLVERWVNEVLTAK